MPRTFGIEQPSIDDILWYPFTCSFAIAIPRRVFASRILCRYQTIYVCYDCPISNELELRCVILLILERSQFAAIFSPLLLCLINYNPVDHHNFLAVIDFRVVVLSGSFVDPLKRAAKKNYNTIIGSVSCSSVPYGYFADAYMICAS